MRCLLNSMVPEIKTPYYLCDHSLLERNISIMNEMERRAGCTVLFSMKSFNSIDVLSEFYGRISGYSTGSSFEFRSVNENQMDHQPILSIYKPAFTSEEIEDYAAKANFIVFNSVEQLLLSEKFLRNTAIECRAKIGVRVNPEISMVDKELYNPCRPNSHLGVRIEELDSLSGKYSGILIHNMCQSRDASEFCKNLDAIEKGLGNILSSEDLNWINFGGGSLFTSLGYNLDLVINRLISFREKFDLHVYLEPSEAWVLDAGYLVATVLDITGTFNKNAILDISVPAHIPDVLEMPYTPHVVNGKAAKASAFTYTLCGLSCMSGDVVGTYDFDTELSVGSKVTFKDMLPYSMVKSSFFNGVAKPDLYFLLANRDVKKIRSYTFEDYINA